MREQEAPYPMPSPIGPNMPIGAPAIPTYPGVLHDDFPGLPGTVAAPSSLSESLSLQDLLNGFFAAPYL